MSETTTEDLAERLRYHATRHPTVLSLRRDLPSLPEDGPAAPGLYLDTSHAPGISVNAELRVSVARLFSVDQAGDRTLVGQIQATRAMDHPLVDWELRFYVHVHKFYATHEVEDEEAWFVRVLEQHYKDGGQQVATAPGIEA